MFALFLFSTCSKPDLPAPEPTGPVTQQEINSWILQRMQEYYLWNQQLPATAGGLEGTVSYFNGLKAAEDRYSTIYNADDHGTIPRGMLRTFGIDYYVVTWPQAQGGAIGIINFVIPGTAAAQNGLRRGDYFTRINGTILTGANAGQLGKELLEANSCKITLAKVTAGGQPNETGQLTLEGRSIVENPVYRNETWSDGGKVTGYLFLNNFDDYYNQDLLQAFIKFKQAGVSELIIDLRYNPGGSVTAAAVLGVLIAPGIDEQKAFVQYTGNARQKVSMRSFKDILAAPSGNNKVMPFNALEPGRLSLARVFILSTGITASSSELLINNLKPYMQVVQIGQTTHGKDVGAVSIADQRTPRRIPWVLLPVTYKLANAKGEGNYEKGIAPQYQADEKSILPLFPVGDKKDPLIEKAMSVITGSGRQAEASSRVVPRVLYDSRQSSSRSAIVTIPSAQ